MSDPVVVEVRSRAGASLGKASLVLGALAFIICWIPFIGAIGMPLSAFGLLLGLIALLLTVLRFSQGLGYAIAGSMTCGVALLVAYAINHAAVAAVTSFDKAVSQLDESKRNAASSTSTGSPEPAPAFEPSDRPITHGDVQVTIESARIGKVLLESRVGSDDSRSKEPYLRINIRIANLSKGKKIAYSTWGEDSFSIRDAVNLKDDLGNTYKLIGFGMTTIPKGSIVRESLYPGKELNDALVFEPPVDIATHLDLELPAKNFEGEGMIRIRIPTSSVSKE